MEMEFNGFYLTISVVFSHVKADALALRPNSLTSVMEALLADLGALFMGMYKFKHILDSYKGIYIIMII